MNPATDELSLREGEELRIECHGEMNIRFTFPESWGTKREVAHLRKNRSNISINGKDIYL